MNERNSVSHIFKTEYGLQSINASSTIITLCYRASHYAITFHVPQCVTHSFFLVFLMAAYSSSHIFSSLLPHKPIRSSTLALCADIVLTDLYNMNYYIMHTILRECYFA